MLVHSMKEQGNRRVAPEPGAIGDGYPYGVVKKATQNRQCRMEEEQPNHTLLIPYVSVLGKDLKMICSKFNIRTVLRMSSTLQSKLCRFNDTDSVMLRSGVVYI